MRERKFSGRKALIAIALIAVLYVNVLVVVTPGVSTATRGGRELILKVAIQDDMKTRNILGSGDVWTYMVLRYCYDSTLRGDPNTGELIPYVAQYSGDQHGVLFGCDEWPKGSGIFDPHNVTVTYNFTNVKFHDSTNVTVDDILASYQIVALHPNWYTDLACLMDNNGEPGSNFTTTHWLWVTKVWESEDKLHAKLNFKLQKDFVNFYKKTLSITIFPQHVWEGTGGSIHEDFGELLDEKGHGVPISEGGFDINRAISWDITDDSHVIGNGPFKFKQWMPGQYAKIEKYEEYFYMKPNIDGILFKIYKTADAAVMALRGGHVDYVAWSIPPDYIPDLMGVENIGLSSAAEPGFFYLAFNMRKKDFGYDSTLEDDPATPEDERDVGKQFRKAVAHCVDKKTIVTTLLQNFGMIADGPVSPANTLWFNNSLPTYPPDVEKAKLILDNAGIVDADHDGWRELPTIGDDQFDILTPCADYDPIMSAAGLMIATQMQEAGINVLSKPTAFGEIVRRIDARDFDMYLLNWKIEGTDPDYLYNFFYSGNANAGQNYPGYNNAKFDELILASRAEMNETKRVELIKWCQGILADDLPYDVLYYRQNIEAYRSDRFTNWTLDSSGSLYNYWSLMGIKPPSSHWLCSSITTTSTVISEGTARVVVTIKDQDQNPVEGAMVYLEIENTNVTRDPGTILPTSGITNINGQLIAKYTAPDVPSGTEDQTVLIYVRKHNETWGATYTSPDGTVYDPAEASFTTITIKLAGSQFLAIAITADYDIIESAGTTALNIVVTDQESTYLNPHYVDGAFVTIFVWSPAKVEPPNGTTVNGTIGVVTFTAPTVSVNTFFEITVDAQKSGYDSATQTITIQVLKSTEDVTPPTVSSTLPTSGQIDVPIDMNIVITFSEAMNKTATQSAFTLETNGVSMSGIFGWNDANNTMTFNPIANLSEESKYWVNITTVATDLADNPLSTPWSSSFTTEDVTPPTVSSTLPTSGQIDVPINTNIIITFSEAMNKTATQSAFTLETSGVSVSGIFTWNLDNDTMTFNPTTDLIGETKYWINITTVATDLAGNPSSTPWSSLFTTEDVTPPTVSSALPTSGQIDVPINTNIIITFSEAMDKTATQSAFTLETSGVSISGIFSWNLNNDTMTFNPTTDLIGETKYWINITTVATDLAGNPLSTPRSSPFTTEDVTPPTVSSTSPTSGQLDVPINTTITITFSETMNKTTAQEAIRISGGLIPIWFSWSNDNTTVTFTPSSDLDYETQYTIVLNASIAQDIAGNKLDGNKDGIGGDDYSWSFTSEIGIGTLYGTLTDKDDNPIPNATITAYYTNGTIASTTTTDGNGNYTINLLPGAYDIKIEKSGYETQWEKDVEVTPGETETISIDDFSQTVGISDYLWIILLIIVIIVIISIVALIAKKKKVTE